MSQLKVGTEEKATKTICIKEVICRWLNLPAESWPVDHYTLLGLRAGEVDMNRIESAVHERLNRVRCFQLSQPDPATAAMNRIAEAYACLSDPHAKLHYDNQLGVEIPVQASRDTVALKQDTEELTAVTPGEITPTGETVNVVAFKDAQLPPVRTAEPAKNNGAPQTDVIAALQLSDEPTATTTDDAKVKTVQEPLISKPIDPVVAEARTARSALEGISTRNQIYQRVQATRNLLWIWRRLGRYMKSAKRPLASANEAKDLHLCLAKVEHLVDEFPAFFARPGKPGYRVAILANDEDPIRAFREMDYRERDGLSLEWKTSFNVLREHQAFLRDELKSRRKESWLITMTRLFRSWFEENRIWGFVAFATAFLCLLVLVLLFLTR